MKNVPAIFIAWLFSIMVISTACAEIKCQEPLSQTATAFDVSAKGKLDGLKRILNADGQVDIKPIVRNLLAEYPNADKVAAQYSLIQLTCEMIKNLNIPDERKFDRLQELRKDILSEFRSTSHLFEKRNDIIYVVKAADRNYVTKSMLFVKLMTYKRCWKESDGVHMSGSAESPYVPASLFSPGFKVINDVTSKYVVQIDLSGINKEANRLREAYDYMMRFKECVDFAWRFYFRLYDEGLGKNEYFYQFWMRTTAKDDSKEYKLNWLDKQQYEVAKDEYFRYRDPCGMRDWVTLGDMMGRLLAAALPDEFGTNCKRQPLGEVELVR
jgi:hypothetical protein